MDFRSKYIEMDSIVRAKPFTMYQDFTNSFFPTIWIFLSLFLS